MEFDWSADEWHFKVQEYSWGLPVWTTFYRNAGHSPAPGKSFNDATGAPASGWVSVDGADPPPVLES